MTNDVKRKRKIAGEEEVNDVPRYKGGRRNRGYSTFVRRGKAWDRLRIPNYKAASDVSSSLHFFRPPMTILYGNFAFAFDALHLNSYQKKKKKTDVLFTIPVTTLGEKTLANDANFLPPFSASKKRNAATIHRRRNGPGGLKIKIEISCPGT